MINNEIICDVFKHPSIQLTPTTLDDLKITIFNGPVGTGPFGTISACTLESNVQIRQSSALSLDRSVWQDIVPDKNFYLALKIDSPWRLE